MRKPYSFFWVLIFVLCTQVCTNSKAQNLLDGLCTPKTISCYKVISGKISSERQTLCEFSCGDDTIVYRGNTFYRLVTDCFRNPFARADEHSIFILETDPRRNYRFEFKMFDFDSEPGAIWKTIDKVTGRNREFFFQERIFSRELMDSLYLFISPSAQLTSEVNMDIIYFVSKSGGLLANEFYYDGILSRVCYIQQLQPLMERRLKKHLKK